MNSLWSTHTRVEFRIVMQSSSVILLTLMLRMMTLSASRTLRPFSWI